MFLVFRHSVSLPFYQIGSLIMITSKHATTIFSPLQSYSKKTLRKRMPRKALVKTERIMCLCPPPPGIP